MEQVQYDTSIAIVLAGKAQKSLASAQAYLIDSPTMAELAGEDLRQIKTLQKDVEAQRTGIVKPLNDAVKAVNALFKAPTEYLEQAETTLKRALLGWTSEQERLAAIARAQAEAEAEAERARLAAEAEEKVRVAQALAETEGSGYAVEQAQAEAMAAIVASNVVTFTPVHDAPAKVTGISGRTTYAATVTDLMALVQAVAKGEAPIEAIVADTKFLNAQARAFKKAGPLYPGVVSVAERSLSARAA
jgi:hypothetical protein